MYLSQIENRFIPIIFWHTYVDEISAPKQGLNNSPYTSSGKLKIALFR